MLCDIEKLCRTINTKPNVVTFGVNYDGVFTQEALSFMYKLAKIKYPATEGCLNYLVMRANWIDHWVKAIQSGLVNILARGMARSFTDLAAQHAVTRVENHQSLTPPPVPQGAPRFISGEIVHSVSEAFPPYRRPEVTFIDGVNLREKVTSGVRTEPVASSLNSPPPPRGGSLSVIRRRDLLFTPRRGPLNRSLAEQTDKSTEEDESMHSDPARKIDKSSINLVTLSDESVSEDLGRYTVDSIDHEISQSLISSSQSQELVLETARSSQGPNSSSDEYGFRLPAELPEIGDIVEIFVRQTRKGRRGRPVTKCGRVTEIKPDDPTRVRMDTGPGKFRKVLKIITRLSTLMISKDTQSQSEHSCSQLY